MSWVVALSFSGVGSFIEVTLTMFRNVVPDGVAGGTCVVSVSVAVCPAGKLTAVQVTVPPAPTAGVEQTSAGPPVWTSETNVIVPGRTSLSETF